MKAKCKYILLQQELISKVNHFSGFEFRKRDFSFIQIQVLWFKYIPKLKVFVVVGLM